MGFIWLVVLFWSVPIGLVDAQLQWVSSTAASSIRHGLLLLGQCLALVNVPMAAHGPQTGDDEANEAERLPVNFVNPDLHIRRAFDLQRDASSAVAHLEGPAVKLAAQRGTVDAGSGDGCGLAKRVRDLEGGQSLEAARGKTGLRVTSRCW